MTKRSLTAAEMRAAIAALHRLPRQDDVECFLLVDDTEEDMTEIRFLLCELASGRRARP